jgi:hypothetical protein
MPTQNKGTSQPYSSNISKIIVFRLFTSLLMYLIPNPVVELVEFLLRIPDVAVPNIISETDYLE